MPTLLRDLGLALRCLRKTPASSAAAIAIIAVGLGANLAVFAVAYGILLRPLPFEDPDRLVILTVHSNEAEFGIRHADVEDWRARLSTFESMAFYGEEDVIVRGTGPPRAARSAVVGATFFDVLGVHPAAGRPDVGEVVLSDRFASKLSSGESEPLGSRLRVAGLADSEITATVGATMPDEFAFPADEIDLWILDIAMAAAAAEGSRTGRIVARLAEGAHLEAARSDAQRALRARLGDGATVIALATVTPVGEMLTGSMRPVLGATGAAAALVLLATCANVAILLLGRAILRSRDDAVRLALGAQPWRLAQASLLESLVLAVAGGGAGWWLAGLGLRALDSVAQGVLPRWRSVTLDADLAVAGFGLVLLLSLLSGAATAVQTRRHDATAALRATGSARNRPMLLSALVVLQVALSLVLVVGAALLLRSVLRMHQEDAGFDGSSTVVARFTVDGEDLPAQALLDEVRTLPGVAHAGLGSALPGSSKPMTLQVRRLGDGIDESLLVDAVSVTPGFLEAVGARLRGGRSFSDTDDRAAGPDIVLSRSGLQLIEIYTGETIDPSEQSLRSVAGREYAMHLPPVAQFDGTPRILGIVDDVKFKRLDDPPSAALYVPWSARPARHSAYLAVRVEGDASRAAAFVATLRKVVARAAPEMPAPEIRTLDELTRGSVADRSLVLLPALGFAMVALAIALGGVFAVMGRSVAERRRDFAVRMALGASRAGIARHVLGRSGRLVATGLGVGLLLTGWASRGLRSLLYGIEPTDPVAWTLAALLVATTCLLAAYVPALRAAGVEPNRVLRGE